MDGVLLCKKAVSMDGWIVVKENMSTDREAEMCMMSHRVVLAQRFGILAVLGTRERSNFK